MWERPHSLFLKVNQRSRRLEGLRQEGMFAPTRFIIEETDWGSLTRGSELEGS